MTALPPIAVRDATAAAMLELPLPKRIQLSRRKGWRKPEGAVVVSRPGPLGNPFSVKSLANAGLGNPRRGAVAAFEDWLAGNQWACGADKFEAKRAAIIASLPVLRGKDLACWCPLDQPCHADVLLRMANDGAEQPMTKP